MSTNYRCIPKRTEPQPVMNQWVFTRRTKAAKSKSARKIQENRFRVNCCAQFQSCKLQEKAYWWNDETL